MVRASSDRPITAVPILAIRCLDSAQGEAVCEPFHQKLGGVSKVCSGEDKRIAVELKLTSKAAYFSEPSAQSWVHL